MRLAAVLVIVSVSAPALAGNLELASVAWSPDGKTVAVGAFEQTIVIDADTRRELVRVRESRGRHQVSFLPDGRLVTQGSDADTAPVSWRSIVWEARTGARVVVVAAPSACATDTEVAWGCRPDGTGWRGRYQSWNGQLVVERWDGTALGSGWSATPAHSMYRMRVALAATGDAALAGKYAYSATQTEPMLVHTTNQTPAGVQRGYFYESRPKLVAGGFIRIHNRGGAFRCENLGLGKEIVSARFSADGQTLLAGDAGGAVFVLSADCKLVRTLSGLTSEVVGVASSSDRVVAISRTGEVAWWELRSGRAIAAGTIR